MTLVYQPDQVSTATIVTRLAEELDRLGHDVAILTSTPHYNVSAAVRSDSRYRYSPLRPFRLMQENGIRVVRCYMPRKPTLVLRRALDYLLLHVLMAVAMLRHFRDREITIVISPPLTLALLGMLARRLGNGRVVYNAQELWPDVPRELGVIRSGAVLAALGAIERWIYRSVDAVVAIGPAFARTIVARGGNPKSTWVIPNFVDNDLISPRQKDNPLARSWGLESRPVVLYAGNIGLTQDFETLLACAERLVARDVQFLIVGGGAARRMLEQAIRRTRPPNVHLKDFVPPGDLSDLYGLADVVVVPLRAGYDRLTTPSKIFSAMAASRPLIACATGDSDLAATILDSGAGVVVPPGRSDLLAEGILSLMGPSAESVWDRKRAQEAAQRHSPTSIASRYDELLRSLCPVRRERDRDGDPVC